VIPYGVGVDIACRMKMSKLDWILRIIITLPGKNGIGSGEWNAK
jgi:hypothetical protein